MTDENESKSDVSTDESQELEATPDESKELDTTPARVMAIAADGIKDSEDIKRLLCALMPDILEGKVNVAVANATVQASRQLIKMVELEMKYGSGQIPRTGTRRPNALQLVGGDDEGA